MKEIFKKVIDNTNSMSEASRVIGINYKKFKKYAKKYNLWKPNQGFKGGKKPIKKLEDVFSGKKFLRSDPLKKRLIHEGYLNNECYNCGNKGEWQNEKLILELDHINGDGKDNRLENLRILCPNCHSQTDNFRGRNKRKKAIKTNEEIKKVIETSSTISEVCKKMDIIPKGGNYQTIKNKMSEMKITLKGEPKLSDFLDLFEIKKIKELKNEKRAKIKNVKKCKCGEEILNKSKLCIECQHRSNRKVERPGYDKLIDEVNTLGYSATGRKYGVSDNSIRKWIKKYEKDMGV